MSIVTKIGDQGKTRLLDNSEVNKFNLRVHAYGIFDEFTSFLGMTKIQSDITQNDYKLLENIQNNILIISTELATKTPEKYKYNKLSDNELHKIEEEIYNLEKILKIPNKIILPGKNQTESWFHICRSTIRRGERYLTELAAKENIRPLLLKYINRLSDLLFLLALKYTKKD